MASVSARSLEVLSDFVGIRMYKTLPTQGKLRIRPGRGRGQALMLKHTVGQSSECTSTTDVGWTPQLA